MGNAAGPGSQIGTDEIVTAIRKRLFTYSKELSFYLDRFGDTLYY
mgnify:CR=1 FL=1